MKLHPSLRLRRVRQPPASALRSCAHRLSPSDPRSAASRERKNATSGAVKIRRPKVSPLFVLGLAVALQACSAPRAVMPEKPADTVAANRPQHSRAPTFEDILRWATQGESGWNQIASGLAGVLDLKPLPANSLYGKGPGRLSDNRILLFASINHPAKQIDIGVSETACVAPAWAASVLGAKLDPVYQDAHGVDRGQVYDATVNGMFVRINTTPETYRCVTAMHLYPAD